MPNWGISCLWFLDRTQNYPRLTWNSFLIDSLFLATKSKAVVGSELYLLFTIGWCSLNYSFFLNPELWKPWMTQGIWTRDLYLLTPCRFFGTLWLQVATISHCRKENFSSAVANHDICNKRSPRAILCTPSKNSLAYAPAVMPNQFLLCHLCLELLAYNCCHF